MARGYDAVLAAMNENRKAIDAAVAQSRANERLSGEGKNAEITEAYIAAMGQHNALRAELAAAREAELVTARGRAFTARDVTSAGQANYREALAQAREAVTAADPHRLNALLDQAAATRDGALLRALAFVGYQADSWGLVEAVARYDSDVANLLDVESRIGGRQSPDMRLANSMASTAPTRPPEVSSGIANSMMR
jgi:hypothetical protein